MKKDIQDCQRSHVGTIEPPIEVSTASQTERLEYLVDMLKQLQLQANGSRRLTISQRKPENSQKLSMDTIRKRRGYTKNADKLSGVTCFKDYSAIQS